MPDRTRERGALRDLHELAYAWNRLGQQGPIATLFAYLESVEDGR